jgi:signal transduction histidine kinase
MNLSEKKEIHRYIPILVLIFIMIIISLFTFEHQYFSNKYFGQLINIAGKQRMLSQRLVLEASDYLHEPIVKNKKRYLEYLTIMQNDHKLIEKMDLGPYERRHYSIEPNLNEMVYKYFRMHKEFIKSPTQEHFDAIKASSRVLLNNLDKAVALHQTSYERNLQRLQLAKLVETIMFLLVLAASWFFVFRTSAKRLEQSYEKLEEANLTLEHKIEEAVAKNREQKDFMIQQSKLAALGEMIGNIAHQWRQPISAVSAIMMNIKWTAIQQGVDPNFLNERMQEANEQLQYMSQTIEDFRSFFKPDKEKEYFDLYTVYNQAYKILKDNLESNNIKLSLFRTRDAVTYGYPNEFAQVIMNIVANARDIMIEKKIKQPRIEIHLEKDDKYVYCKIKDNGGGIPEDIVSKVFDPYFSTKFNAQGTGMGLYMSKIIIENNMQGILSVANSNVGAVFSIRLELHKLPEEEEV